MRVVTIAAEKGGSGRTTLAVHLAAALAERQGPALLVDTDPHAAATFAVGLDPEGIRPGLAEALEAGRLVAGSLHATAVEGVECWPARLELVDTQARLMVREHLHALRQLLRALGDRFPWVVVDTPPALGYLAVNALVAADGLVVPVVPHPLGLRSLPPLLSTVESIRRGPNPRLRLLGVVPSMVEAHTSLAVEALAELRRTFKGRLLPAIPKRVRLAELAGERRSILQAAPTSHLAEVFRRLAREVEKRAEGG